MFFYFLLWCNNTKIVIFNVLFCIRHILLFAVGLFLIIINFLDHLLITFGLFLHLTFSVCRINTVYLSHFLLLLILFFGICIFSLLCANMILSIVSSLWTYCLLMYFGFIFSFLNSNRMEFGFVFNWLGICLTF